MAKKKESHVPPARNPGPNKALLLIDCAAGKCGQVVTLDAAEIAELVAQGAADDNPAAVAAYE